MSDNISKLLHSILCLSIVVLSPGLTAYAAAAEVSVRIPGSVVTGPINMNIAAPIRAPELGLSVAPGLLNAAVPVNLQAPVLDAAAVAPQAVAQQAVAAAPVAAAPQAEVPAGTLGSLIETQRPEAPAQAAASSDSAGSRWSRLFDNVLRRRGVAAPYGNGRGTAETSSSFRGAEPQAVAGTVSRPVVSGLAKTSASSNKTSVSVPAPKASVSRGLKRAGTVLAIGAVMLLATSGIAMAAPAALVAAGAAAAPAVGITSLSFLSAIHPLATAISAAAGAVFGLIAANKKGDATTGEIIASVVRYGVLGGAGAYVMLDLTVGLFSGFAAVAMKPLPTALATAALAQSAFQGKFADPASSAADRIMSAFPAVAAALGLSVGIVTLAPVALPMALAMNAMSITGVAAAIYAALYKPGKSSADGPAKMGRGFVLQSLMAGLALSLSNPYAVLTFSALAAWGFWDVLATTYREILSRVPESVRARFSRKP